MKIDFSVVLKDIEGEPLKDEKGRDFTMARAACAALLASFPDEKEIGEKEKVDRFKFALAATNGGEQEIPMNDAVLLKSLIAKLYGPLVVGRVNEIIGD